MIRDFSLNRFELRAVERRLTSELWTAKDKHRLARSRLSDIMRGTPSGIPPSDCAVLESHDEREAAVEAFNRALQRFTNFVMHGTVPEDLADVVHQVEPIAFDIKQKLLGKEAGDLVADRACISQIVEQYRAICAVRDLEISVPELFNEKLQFWFHITRLRLACLLRATNILPDLQHALAAQSVLALAVLSPHLVDAL
jgi:hypothetical protein